MVLLSLKGISLNGLNTHCWGPHFNMFTPPQIINKLGLKSSTPHAWEVSLKTQIIIQWFWNQTTYVKILPLTSYVTLNNFINLSRLQYPHLQRKVRTVVFN